MNKNKRETRAIRRKYTPIELDVDFKLANSPSVGSIPKSSGCPIFFQRWVLGSD